MRFSALKQARYDSGPNMTPLVDVVMVILIFLMLSGGFGIASHFLPASLPLIASHAPPRSAAADQVTMLEVYVSSPTEDTFRARLADGATFTDVESLRDALAAKRAAHEAQGGSAERMQVMIDARRSTRYHHLIAVYEAAMAAKWPKIGFRSARD